MDIRENVGSKCLERTDKEKERERERGGEKEWESTGRKDIGVKCEFRDGGVSSERKRGQGAGVA